MSLGRLTEPFKADEVHWRPIKITGSRALVVPYIDVRSVEDRLDEVFGPGGWGDEFQQLPDGCVVCTLSVYIEAPGRDGKYWVVKSDVGSAPEPRAGGGLFSFLGRRRQDCGDQVKAAFTDSLKRAAVKLGIGRYLYRFAPVWADYDPVTGEVIQPPALGPSMLPAEKA